ncbi:hypothetical protein ACE38W_05020 [Chitinophaga sp. Hz27]|uniref:hypothetical protein n=1 Tax=Chitinophaga sp. Hz27 TaxID=3347169 RepID=UPI0035DB4E1C
MTQEEIFNAIINKAKQNMGHNDAHDISIDPVFHLLATIIAKQLSILHQEQKIFQASILEQLAGALINSNNYGSAPAHGIMAAKFDKLSDHSETIHSYHQFIHPEKQHYLTPCNTHKLIAVNLTYILTTDKIYHQHQSEKKLLLSGIISRNTSPTLYLGLIPNNEYPISLDGLTIFFTLSQQDEEQKFLQRLKYVKCFIADQELKIKPWPSSDVYHSHETVKPSSVLQQITDKWSQQFLRLHTEHLFSPGAQGLSAEAYTLLHQHLQQPEKYIWLKLEFPGTAYPLMDEVNCHINSFPVANILPVTQTIKLSEHLNIHTLECKDHLSEIVSIKDQQGDTYRLELLKIPKELSPGECTILPEHVHCLDQRSLQAQLHYFAEQITSELYRHKSTHDHLTIRAIEELERSLQQLYSTLQSPNEIPARPALFINKKTHSKFLTIEMLITQGDQVSLSSQSRVAGPATLPGNNFSLVTAVIGGKHQPTPNEKLHLLRSQLISNNRIVSENDIRLLCRHMIGTSLSTVDIIRKIGFGPNNHLMKIIHVNIQLHKGADVIHEQQLIHFRQNILLALKQNSWITHPIQINFNYSTNNTVNKD